MQIRERRGGRCIAFALAAVQWAKKITSFNGKRKQRRHMDPMTADEVLVESFQKQLGLRFRPLLSKADVATRQELVHFVLGVEPAPQGFEVGEHLLIRPQQPLNMSRFFDPAVVRAHDLYAILLQGLPSIDKNFAARYNFEESKWYYHRKDNVRLTSAAYTYAKGVFLTSHVGDDLEYPTFLLQTGSQVVETLALIDKIGERVHASYLTGESSQASWLGNTGNPRKVEIFCDRNDAKDPLRSLLAARFNVQINKSRTSSPQSSKG